MKLFMNKKDCCGCAACVNICPKSAITMEKDEIGQYFPRINKTLCIDCGACKRVCDFQRKDENQFGHQVLSAYGAASKNGSLIKKSASGGMFAQLAEFFLEKGGVVYGAAMLQENKLRVKHIRVEDQTQLYLIQGSKYIQSDTCDTYQKVKQDLAKGRLVLFSGTPCQAAALRSFLKRDYENLIVVDIVCHGVSTAQIFQDYISFLEKKKNIKITNFAFRDKSVGWGLDAKYEYLKKSKLKTQRLYYKLSSFYNYYEKAAISRENCYHCKYACPSRIGDITLGDFWGVEKNQPDCLRENGGIFDEKKGISFCLVNSQRGAELFEKILPEINYVGSDFETISKQNGNLLKPTAMPLSRNEIMELYKQKGYEAIDQLYWKKIGYKKIYYYILAKAPRDLKKKVRTLVKK